MTQKEHEWVVAKLDWYYSVAEMIISYFKKHTNVSFEIARETWKITKTQLQTFLRDYSAEIYLDEALYNYYLCISTNFDFIDNNLAEDNKR